MAKKYSKFTNSSEKFLTEIMVIKNKFHRQPCRAILRLYPEDRQWEAKEPRADLRTVMCGAA